MKNIDINCEACIEELDMEEEMDIEEGYEDNWLDESDHDRVLKTLERLFEEKRYKDFYVTIRTKELDVRRAPITDIEKDISGAFQVNYIIGDVRDDKIFREGDLKSITYNVKKGTYLLRISHTR